QGVGDLDGPGGRRPTVGHETGKSDGSSKKTWVGCDNLADGKIRNRRHGHQELSCRSILASICCSTVVFDGDSDSGAAAPVGRGRETECPRRVGIAIVHRWIRN